MKVHSDTVKNGSLGPLTVCVFLHHSLTILIIMVRRRNNTRRRRGRDNMIQPYSTIPYTVIMPNSSGEIKPPSFLNNSVHIIRSIRINAVSATGGAVRFLVNRGDDPSNMVCICESKTLTIGSVPQTVTLRVPKSHGPQLTRHSVSVLVDGTVRGSLTITYVALLTS